MLHGEAVVLSPIVGHLVGLMLISCQLVKEMFRIRTSTEAILVDLLHVQRAVGGDRVPDLEVDGVHRRFAKEIGVWHLIGGGCVVGPWTELRIGGNQGLEPVVVRGLLGH